MVVGNAAEYSHPLVLVRRQASVFMVTSVAMHTSCLHTCSVHKLCASSGGAAAVAAAYLPTASLRTIGPHLSWASVLPATTV